MKRKRRTMVCQVCGKEQRWSDVVPALLVRDSIVERIRKTVPDWSMSGYICVSDLNRFRAEHVRKVLEEEKGEVAELELQIVQSLKEHEVIAYNINQEYDATVTFGESLADRIAEFGGSWGFLLVFGAVLALWIGINSIAFLSKPFDPYPYILLNLALSCLAAIQAPVIMMSQNRQESRDRLRAEAQWALFTRNRSMLLKRESLIRERINGGSYDALVGAMSDALEKLSGDISKGILSVLPRRRQDNDSTTVLPNQFPRQLRYVQTLPDDFASFTSAYTAE